MTQALQALIREAGTALGSTACASGNHVWQSIGGRACPHPKDIGGGECSQAVYECSVCGETDYGDPGGPGHDDCANNCHFKWRIGLED